MKKIALLILLTIGIDSQAGIPVNMPQTVYDEIVQTVITDLGYFDSVAVEESVSQWLLLQPLANTDGELIDQGSCTNCAADSQGTQAQFEQPRNVELKAKLLANGKHPSVLAVTWKEPNKLHPSIRDNYELTHYMAYISKNNQSYELLKVSPKLKRNGQSIKNNQIKFNDLGDAEYSVQIQAVYKLLTSNNKSTTQVTTKVISEEGSTFTD